jgi:hypothetical protein
MVLFLLHQANCLAESATEPLTPIINDAEIAALENYIRFSL